MLLSFVFLHFLQEFPKPTLGPWGTIVLTFLAVLFAFFSWRQKGWKEAAAAAQVNLASAKETIITLRTDKEELVKKCAGLEMKTNIEPLENTVKAWISESKDRFTTAMNELAEIHRNNTANLLLLTEEIKSQRQSSEASYKVLAEALTQHVEDDTIIHRQEYEERHGQMEQVARILDAVEKRTAATNLALGYLDSGKASRHTEPSVAAGK